MSIDEKLKASKGKFAVCVWDPYPRRDMKDPKVVRPYTREGYAIRYAKKMNGEWLKKNKEKKGLTGEEVVAYLMDGRDSEIEREYFVINDEGLRVF